jgi:hypothetical protein
VFHGPGNYGLHRPITISRLVDSRIRCSIVVLSQDFSTSHPDHRQTGILNVQAVRSESLLNYPAWNRCLSTLGVFLLTHSSQPEHISPNRPIILDESYASPETAALHEEGYEGLVARADSPKGILSMSSYGKPQPPQLQGTQFEAGSLILQLANLSTGYERAYPENPYSFAGPIYGSQPSVSSTISAPVYQNATQLTMAYPPNQTRPGYDDQAGPYLNVGSTPVPEITSWTPSRGTRDTKFQVYFTTLYPLMTANSPIFFLMFGQRKCQPPRSR